MRWIGLMAASLLVGCSSPPRDAAPAPALEPARAETPAPAPAAPAPARRSFADFRPSRDGFAFRNDFSGSPLPVSLGPAEKSLGLPSHYGLCGGMSSAAADYFLASRPVPAEAAPPAHGTPLYTFLYSRQAASFGPLNAMAMRFLEWMQLPDDGTDGTRARTVPEIAPIEAALARGEPVLLGLVLVSTKETCEPWHNHQVLAYAAKRDGPTLDLSIYDPNFPKRDDAIIRITDDGGLPRCERIVPGRKPTSVRGLFKMPYVPTASSAR